MKPRHLAPGQLPDGSWASPEDLRCVGGPADGQWYSSPPEAYQRREVRGGAMWQWCPPGVVGFQFPWPPHPDQMFYSITPAQELVITPLLHALPDEAR